jgi:hypothetical protein
MTTFYKGAEKMKIKKNDEVYIIAVQESGFDSYSRLYKTLNELDSDINDGSIEEGDMMYLVKVLSVGKLLRETKFIPIEGENIEKQEN